MREPDYRDMRYHEDSQLALYPLGIQYPMDWGVCQWQLYFSHSRNTSSKGSGYLPSIRVMVAVLLAMGNADMLNNINMIYKKRYKQ